MKEWELSIGTFPGILFGMRTYPNESMTNHVIYIGFIDVCITIFKN
jgi:hypothetical protein